jgi:hypothetical protein
MCLNVKQASASEVHFIIWSEVAQPKARIPYIMIDTGSNTTLFSRFSLLLVPPGVKMAAQSPRALASLPTVTPDFQVGIHGSGPAEVAGALRPMQFLVISGILNQGKTYIDVINAINQSLNPATSSSGLRVALIAWFLDGGPPPGVASIHDDGGFVISGPSSHCGRR